MHAAKGGGASSPPFRTAMSRLRAERPAINPHLSVRAGPVGQIRPPVPVAWLQMHEGTWTLADCPPTPRRSSSARSGSPRSRPPCSSGAAIPNRRRPAGSSRASSRRTTHSCWATWKPRARTSARRWRRAARSACTATTTSTASRHHARGPAAARARRRRRLAPPESLRRGLRRPKRDARAPRGRGCGLVLTVDCGITAVAEVAEATERGLDVIVTDHHRPGETLPDCPIVATRPSGYPFPELCGTGVVYKLGQALSASTPTFRGGTSTSSRSRRSPTSCLSSTRTVACDRGATRPRTHGEARLACAHAERGRRPSHRRRRSRRFRLAPRLNAAGRLGHPREALELLLTEDEAEARRLADSLEELNRERQAVEARILREAVAQVEAGRPRRVPAARTPSPEPTGTRA